MPSRLPALLSSKVMKAFSLTSPSRYSIVSDFISSLLDCKFNSISVRKDVTVHRHRDLSAEPSFIRNTVSWIFFLGHPRRSPLGTRNIPLERVARIKRRASLRRATDVVAAHLFQRSFSVLQEIHQPLPKREETRWH